MTFFAKEKIDCTADTYILPVCNYTGSIQKLPNITLYMQKRFVQITPQIYAQTHVNGSSITLNLRALSPNLTGPSYVTKQYADYIILDINFMTYYYVTFLNKRVILNIAGPTPSPSIEPSNILPYVIGGCLGLIVILIVGGYCYASRRKKSLKVKIMESSSIDSNQKLLVNV